MNNPFAIIFTSGRKGITTVHTRPTHTAAIEFAVQTAIEHAILPVGHEENFRKSVTETLMAHGICLTHNDEEVVVQQVATVEDATAETALAEALASDEGNHVRVEYDLNYWGGNYSGTGEIRYISTDLIEFFDNNVPVAFQAKTGISAVHVVHYESDTLYDKDGVEIED